MLFLDTMEFCTAKGDFQVGVDVMNWETMDDFRMQIVLTVLGVLMCRVAGTLMELGGHWDDMDTMGSEEGKDGKASSSPGVQPEGTMLRLPPGTLSE